MSYYQRGTKIILRGYYQKTKEINREDMEMVTVTEAGKRELRKYFKGKDMSPLRIYMTYG